MEEILVVVLIYFMFNFFIFKEMKVIHIYTILKIREDLEGFCKVNYLHYKMKGLLPC